MTATLCMASFDLPTHSASAFLLRYIAPRLGPAALYGPVARRPFFSLPGATDLFVGVGHGEPDAFTGAGDSPIWQVGKVNPKETSGKVVKLLSCLTGQQLGPDLVSNGGARAFLGYDDDIVWLADSGYSLWPYSDPYAQICLMPIVDGLDALLDGSSCSESLAIEKAGYQANAAATDSQLLQSCLNFNLAHAILLGDPNARISPRPRISLPPPPPLLF